MNINWLMFIYIFIMNVQVYLKWMYLNNQEWSLIYIYMCICLYVLYAHSFWKCKINRSQSEGRCNKIIFFFTLISFRLTMIKFTISGCVCTNTHTHIYILVPFFDNLHIIYILIHLNLTRNWAKKDYFRFIKYLF